jgi:hypothetical protein
MQGLNDIQCATVAITVTAAITIKDKVDKFAEILTRLER